MHSMHSFISQTQRCFETRDLTQLAQDAIRLVTPMARRHNVMVELIAPNQAMPID